MKKGIALITLILACGLWIFPMALVQAKPAEEQIQVKLTPEQRSELEALHQGLLEKRKELIQKYVEFGLISTEKGAEIISRMEQHYERIKQGDYQMKWEHHMKHKMKDKE